MIAILTPYGRNEVTAAALILADLVVSAGEEVRLVALGVHETGVHDCWDRRVRSSKGNGIHLSVRGASHCVWFDTGIDAYRQGTLVAAAKAVHIGVARWHRWQRSDQAVIRAYDRVVCPNDHAADLISKTFFTGMLPLLAANPITYQAWSAGLPFTGHVGLASDYPRVAVLYDATCTGRCGSGLLNALCLTLHRQTECTITLLCTRSLRRRDRQELSRLTSEFPTRLSVRCAGSLFEQATVLQAHDLLLVPGLRADF